MKTIRNNVFETNSSSSHSISINYEIFDLDTIIPDEEGIIILRGDEFGWGWDKFNDALTKANYCAVLLKNYPSRFNFSKSDFKELIKEVTGARKVKIKLDRDSYIDHDSINNLSDIYSKDQLKNFIFNKRSWLYIGNDNSYAPNNFYDDPDIPYTHLLEIFYNDKVIYERKFQNYPSDLQLDRIFDEIYYDVRIDNDYVLNTALDPGCVDFHNQTLTFTKYQELKVIDQITLNYEINELTL